MKPNPTREEFMSQMLISEIVITAIVFTGVYLIFRAFWKTQNKDKDENKGN